MIIEIEARRPRSTYDVKMKAGKEDIVWTAPGASRVTITIKDPKARKDGAEHWNPVGVLQGQPPTKPLQWWLDKSKHPRKKVTVYFEYSIEVEYDSGVILTVDPEVIIQP